APGRFERLRRAAHAGHCTAATLRFAGRELYRRGAGRRGARPVWRRELPPRRREGPGRPQGGGLPQEPGCRVAERHRRQQPRRRPYRGLRGRARRLRSRQRLPLRRPQGNLHLQLVLARRPKRGLGGGRVPRGDADGLGRDDGRRDLASPRRALFGDERQLRGHPPDPRLCPRPSRRRRREEGRGVYEQRLLHGSPDRHQGL
ncbi:MAG: hypothetical protein AVDCRST_MAG78-2390, partial [uncultured Rubrobacteraceae bacterium]